MKKLVGESCESAFLIHPKYSVVSRILDDVVSFPPAASVRRNCMGYLFNNGEFRAMRHDGKYKAVMSLSGKPLHGASGRKYAETSDTGK